MKVAPGEHGVRRVIDEDLHGLGEQELEELLLAEPVDLAILVDDAPKLVLAWSHLHAGRVLGPATW